MQYFSALLLFITFFILLFSSLFLTKGCCFTYTMSTLYFWVHTRYLPIRPKMSFSLSSLSLYISKERERKKEREKERERVGAGERRGRTGCFGA
jgi:hypothetical protein